MMEYETLVLVRSEWTAEQIRQLIDRLTAIVDRHGGAVLFTREIGRRPLAYRVAKQTKGIYLYCDYAGDGRVVPEIERTLRYEEGVLKFLTVRLSAAISLEERRTKVLEEEARLAHLFGVGSEPAAAVGTTTDASVEA